MILVFGKTGQVAKELQALGNVTLLDRTQADLKDMEACVRIISSYKPDAIINAAAYTAVDRAEDEEETATQINGSTPGAIAKTCAELGIPIVHISTDYVFDGSGDKPWTTNITPNPQNVYGRSKLKGEEAIAASGAAYAIFRTSWVVSAHGNNFVKTVLRLSETRNILNVVADQIGGPTPARDIAKACLEMAKQLIEDPSKAGTYHFSGAPDTSWCEFAKVIFKYAGRNTCVNPIKTSDYPTPAKRPLNSRLDCTTTLETFNLHQPVWHNGLKDILIDLEIIL